MPTYEWTLSDGRVVTTRTRWGPGIRDMSRLGCGEFYEKWTGAMRGRETLGRHSLTRQLEQTARDMEVVDSQFGGCLGVAISKLRGEYGAAPAPVSKPKPKPKPAPLPRRSCTNIPDKSTGDFVRHDDARAPALVEAMRREIEYNEGGGGKPENIMARRRLSRLMNLVRVDDMASRYAGSLQRMSVASSIHWWTMFFSDRGRFAFAGSMVVDARRGRPHVRPVQAVEDYVRRSSARILFFDVRYVDRHGGHAQMLVIDRSKKTFFLYDPHGTTAELYQKTRSAIVSDGLLSDHTFEEDFVPLGSQARSEIGYCTVHCVLFAAVYMMYAGDRTHREIEWELSFSDQEGEERHVRHRRTRSLVKAFNEFSARMFPCSDDKDVPYDRHEALFAKVRDAPPRRITDYPPDVLDGMYYGEIRSLIPAVRVRFADKRPSSPGYVYHHTFGEVRRAYPGARLYCPSGASSCGN